MGRSAHVAPSIARLAALALLATLLVLPGPAAAGSPRRGTVDVRMPATPGHIREMGRGPSDARHGSSRPFADGVVLVGYRKKISAAQRTAARTAAHAIGHRAISPRAPDVERLRLRPGTSVGQAVQQLRRRSDVRFAEPDYIVTIDHTPGDVLFHDGYMWNLEGPNSVPANSWGSAAAAAWDAGEIGSRDAYVGIVDTGVDINHKDLQANIWTNPFETPGNGVDDDNNGYVDDVHGWDFFHDDASVFDSTASDYHGTHVAGTIGGVGANGEGLVGVNWAVTMIPAKFIDGEGTISGAVAALDYLTDLKTRHGLNIVATNNSWGDPENSVALQDAINRGGDAGILFVAAAGNDGKDIDTSPLYPAANVCATRYDNGTPRGFDCLLSVAAITSAGDKASFSNYGDTSVDIGAPGQQVASTYPGGQYAYLSGTSMAAPHVTGAIALLASCQAAPTASSLRQSVLNHGVATPSLAGITATGDRLHVGAMMADCNTGGPPRVLLTAPAGGTEASAQVWAWFSEPVSGLDWSDLVIGGTSTGWSPGDLIVNGNNTEYILTFTAPSPTPGTLDITLPAGSVMGVSQAGPAAPSTISQIVDRTAPTVTAPSTTIKTGQSLSGAAIPLQLKWSGSDAGSGIRSYVLFYSTDGVQWSILASSLVSTSAIVLADPSGRLRFGVQAIDWAGHGSGIAAGPTFSPRLVQESAASITYSGAWSLAKYPPFSGGAARFTAVGNRSATYSFTGRAVAFVTTLASTRGVVKIKVDGVLVARIDLGSSPTTLRRLVWTRTFPTVKAHKVQITVVGGYGRVDLDAFAVLK